MVKQTNYVVLEITRETEMKLMSYLHGHRGFIAGGCFRHILKGEFPNDVDLFFNSEEDLLQAKEVFRHKKYCLESESRHALTFTKGSEKVQLVKRIYGKPIRVMESFDLGITRASFSSYDGVKGTMLAHKDWKAEVDNKILRILPQMNCPVHTLERVLERCAKEGYTVKESDVIVLAKAIQQCDLGENYY